jgi:hypothetical protein
MVATGCPPKSIWNTTGSVSLCLMTDLEALVEATILCWITNTVSKTNSKHNSCEANIYMFVPLT